MRRSVSLSHGFAVVALPALTLCGVSACRRVGDGREVYVLTNFSASAQDIPLHVSMTDVRRGGELTRVQPPRYGVAVLMRPIP